MKQVPTEPSRLRWVMIGLVFCATVINYLDRQTLSVVAPILREEFEMNNTDYSRVIFAFMLAYTAMNGVSGVLLDRFGTRLGYAVCMAWWSAATLLHALATGPWSLGVFRFLLGMGEAGNWPGGVKVVADWFPERERALASGIFNSGSTMGAIIAPPLIAWIVLEFGWPWSFLFVGASGFLWLLLWSLIYYTPVDSVPQLASRRTDGARLSTRQLLSSRFVCCFMLSKVFIDPVWYFYIFWFPDYLRHARGFDMAAIGRYAWIPFFVAGAGNLAGGWLSASLLRRGVPLSAARKTSISLFALLMSAAIPAVLVADVRLSIACVSLAMMGYTGASANMLAIPADVFSKNSVGSVYGLASMGSGFGGMVFALATGWVIDRYSYPPAFIGFGVMPLVCALILWILMGPIRSGGAELGVRDACT